MICVANNYKSIRDVSFFLTRIRSRLIDECALCRSSTLDVLFTSVPVDDYYFTY
jgi:hypothetical protein